MLDHAQEAIELSRDHSRADLDENRLLSLALTHLIEIVGEAASRVPQEFRSQFPHVPWHEIIGTRNRLIHGYDVVDYDILWVIVQRDLPPLVEQLRAILSESP